MIILCPVSIRATRFTLSKTVARCDTAPACLPPPVRGIQARVVTKRRRRGPPRCSTQRAGIASPHAEGDGLSGATSDRETFAFISGPAGVVGGVPLTRAINPWAMPEAST
jgi:hypothetical protein